MEGTEQFRRHEVQYMTLRRFLPRELHDAYCFLWLSSHSRKICGNLSQSVDTSTAVAYLELEEEPDASAIGEGQPIIDAQSDGELRVFHPMKPASVKIDVV